jgi:2-haloacid dehalogenase
VAKVFGVLPSQVMMVATHQSDLAAARSYGLQTAYIERPMEYGPYQAKDNAPNPDNTLHARDLLQLAELLNC